MRRLSPLLVALGLLAPVGAVHADDLDDIQASGILRHLGYTSGNFVTAGRDGLDVELVQGFAKHLGVDSVFVETDPSRAIGDLTGRHVRQRPDGQAEPLAATPVRGDMIAAGLTIQGWRTQVVAFAEPTFPVGVWVVSVAHSQMKAITPAGPLFRDIARVKQQLKGVSVLGVADSRLDPARYDLQGIGAELRILPLDGDHGDLVPALLEGRAEATLLGAPEALAAVERWPGRVKVIGPITEDLLVAPAFRPKAARLREAFDAYMAGLRADGRYAALVRKYYPAAQRFYASFFAANG